LSSYTVDVTFFQEQSTSKAYNYPTGKLLGFAMRGVFLAARAVLSELQPIGIVAAILLGRVIPLLAIIALECNDRADILLLRSHACLPTFLITR
jgi:hypothetical protein